MAGIDQPKMIPTGFFPAVQEASVAGMDLERLQHLGGDEEVLPPPSHGGVKLPWLSPEAIALQELQLPPGHHIDGHVHLRGHDRRLQHLHGDDEARDDPLSDEEHNPNHLWEVGRRRQQS